MAEQETGLQFKKNRLKTFTDKGWKPSYNVKPEELAAAGFIYEGHEDEVKCVCCLGKIQNWALGDDPVEEHNNLSARCKFVVDLESCEGNPEVVRDSIAKSTEDAQVYAPASYDELDCEKCKKNKREILFEPCKHFKYCTSCSMKMPKCPSCNSPIDKRLKANFIQS